MQILQDNLRIDLLKPFCHHLIIIRQIAHPAAAQVKVHLFHTEPSYEAADRVFQTVRIAHITDPRDLTDLILGRHFPCPSLGQRIRLLNKKDLTDCFRRLVSYECRVFPLQSCQIEELAVDHEIMISVLIGMDRYTGIRYHQCILCQSLIQSLPVFCK